jgi:hypothetical protein
LRETLVRAKVLVNDEWSNIAAVAEALLKAPAGKLDYDQARAVLRTHQAAKEWKSLRWDTPAA